MSRARPRLAAALVAAAATLAACGGRQDPVDPARAFFGTPGSDPAVVGRWGLLAANPGPGRFFGEVVTDTLIFAAGGTGRWRQVVPVATDPSRRETRQLDFQWSSDERSVSVYFTCEPRPLCDPLPPWFGGISIEGQLELRPSIASSTESVRIYGKLEP